jgi:hypothetical protein
MATEGRAGNGSADAINENARAVDRAGVAGLAGGARAPTG